tara:strand:- start:3907 stop:4062 length:156 start_codon:yes stop_codon:yes gene_type:complete
LIKIDGNLQHVVLDWKHFNHSIKILNDDILNIEENVFANATCSVAREVVLA